CGETTENLSGTDDSGVGRGDGCVTRGERRGWLHASHSATRALRDLCQICPIPRHRFSVVPLRRYWAAITQCSPELRRRYYGRPLSCRNTSPSFFISSPYVAQSSLRCAARARS